MNAEFSEALEPLFLRVIDTLGRIERGDAPPPSTVRDKLQEEYDKAASKLGNPPGAELAKKAMAYWIDEMMIAAQWAGQEWWNNNKQETRLFDTNDRYYLFYQDGQEASKLADKSALEVFYLCAVFGFRGLYADPESEAAQSYRESLELPATLADWIRQKEKSIRLAVPPEVERLGESIDGVYPREGPSTLIWSAFFGVVLTAIAGLLVSFWIIYPP